MNNSFKIFCGNSNPVLAQEICDYLGVPLGDATVNSFPDGESFVVLKKIFEEWMSLSFNQPVILLIRI